MTFDATIPNAALTNALVDQNDQIARLIDRAEDAADLERAALMVPFVAAVWQEVGYGYKLAELRRRVIRRAEFLVSVEQTYIAGCRKNDRTLGHARTNLAKLLTLRDFAVPAPAAR